MSIPIGLPKEATNFISIDPGKARSGVVIWEKGKILQNFVIRPMGKKGSFLMEGEKAHMVFKNKWDAWYHVVCKGGLFPWGPIILERAIGNRSNIINAQAEIRGFINAVHMERGGGEEGFKTIGQSEWRRIVREQMGVSWPSGSDEKKATAIALVKEHFQLDVSEDEADAIWIGYAAMKSKLV